MTPDEPAGFSPQLRSVVIAFTDRLNVEYGFTSDEQATLLPALSDYMQAQSQLGGAKTLCQILEKIDFVFPEEFSNPLPGREKDAGEAQTALFSTLRELGLGYAVDALTEDIEYIGNEAQAMGSSKAYKMIDKIGETL